MKSPHLTSFFSLALLGFARFGPTEGFAQAGADTQVDDETIILSPFEVSSAAAGRYQASDAATGGRIATNVLDTPGSITVLTNDFIEDIGGGRILDVAKYVAGVAESTISNAQDRAYVRGFQGSSALVDGFGDGFGCKLRLRGG